MDLSGLTGPCQILGLFLMKIFELAIMQNALVHIELYKYWWFWIKRNKQGIDLFEP